MFREVTEIQFANQCGSKLPDHCARCIGNPPRLMQATNLRTGFRQAAGASGGKRGGG
jgi:hypothetical protein